VGCNTWCFVQGMTGGNVHLMWLASLCTVQAVGWSRATHMERYLWLVPAAKGKAPMPLLFTGKQSLPSPNLVRLLYLGPRCPRCFQISLKHSR
jgi:hypothetical protein